MKLKKLSIISLICMMCFTFLPVNLYALEGDATADTNVVEPAPAEDVITEDNNNQTDESEYISYSYVNENVESGDLADYQIKSNKNSLNSKRSSSVVNSTFTANEKKLYNDLLPEMTKLATGASNSARVTVNVGSYFPKESYTREELGITSFASDSQLSDETIKSIDNLLNMDFGKVTFALFTNNPFDMYWFDKTNMKYGYSEIGNVLITKDGNSMTTSGIQLVFEFPVEKEYSATNAVKTLDLNTTATSAASSKTQAKAKEVVAEVTKNSKTHYDILKGYMDWICGAVDYNKSISLTDDYGNPWQMIWAFDDDASTNIVCEGYAKAFKYLCDQTPELTNDGIEVYLMLGDLGGSGITPQPHMWNVVHMNNGKNYLVDCTNMDPQTIQWQTPNLLFMAGAPKGSGTSDGKAADMYSFSDGKSNVTFTYSQIVMELFTPAEKDLATESYNPSDSATPSDPSTPTDPSTPSDPGTVDPTTPGTEDPSVTPGTDEPTVDEDPDVVDEGDDSDIDESDTEMNDEDTTETKGNTTVKTGDETNMVVYAVLLVVALALVIGLVVYNRKKNKKE